MSGLTENGFIRKTLEEIKTEIEEDLIETFGEINVGTDSLFGQFIGVFSDREDQIWQQMENLYYSKYPASANGISLDYAVQYNGITRKPSTPSSVVAQLNGDEGTNVPSNNKCSLSVTGEIFSLISDVEITKNNLHQFDVSIPVDHDVDKAKNNTTFEVIINSNIYDYTTGVDETVATVANEITSKINTGESNVNADDDAGDGTIIIIQEPSGTVLSINDYFTGDANTEVNIDEIWTPGVYSAQNNGDIPVPINSLTIIETPVNGFDAIKNLYAGVSGSDPESDAELRQRRLSSLQIAGASTLPAIKARLEQNLEDANAVFVYENRDDVIDGEGRPPHSFEVIVDIVDTTENDNLIASEIWNIKPAGIQTYGSDSGEVIDSNGDTQTIYFSRPTQVPIYVTVDYTKYNEEDFPTDGEQLIKNAVIEHGNTLEIGEDVISQRFHGKIFSSVPGIETLTVKISKSPGPTSTNTISIDSRELATFNINNVNINLI